MDTREFTRELAIGVSLHKFRDGRASAGSDRRRGSEGRQLWTLHGRNRSFGGIRP